MDNRWGQSPSHRGCPFSNTPPDPATSPGHPHRVYGASAPPPCAVYSVKPLIHAYFAYFTENRRAKMLKIFVSYLPTPVPRGKTTFGHQTSGFFLFLRADYKKHAI